VNDLTVVPGANTYPVKSFINNTIMLNFIIGKDSLYPSGVVPLDIVGNKSVYNGQEIPYFSDALRATKLQTTLNVTQVLIDSGLGILLGGLGN
jgi:hypothetical protein